jgi:hypothetical protein
MGLLTSFVLDDREGFMEMSRDLSPELTLALVARSAQFTVDILAQALGITREDAMALVAQSVAAVDQDDA